ncbi:hypothetical protein [Mesorhizobium sp. ORS 3428]|uniref:hypothetical protein n=1 Tax=Mesorhizobium sp. ORS 3428 TaxID=540997 RepID=UPI0008DAA690|nr:hypothetical protein [Mesorhizobium sp. ORS 3428]OHV86219.1 hypothetical protein ORS3428_25120 [Mesorhizobium sp. ORS 3428]
MRIEPDIGGASVVVVGNFNPAIFTPHWLSTQGLITTAEADAANVVLIHPEVAQIEFANTIMNAHPNQFSLETTQAPWVSLVDLVGRIFGEMLPHTPIFQFGINRNVHFSVEKEAVRNQIGRILAPLDPWGEWGQEIASQDVPYRGGVSHLTIQQKWSDGAFKGSLNVTVEPSVKIAGNTGIYVRVNDHCELVDREEIDGTAKLLAFMRNRFDDSIRKSEQIVDQVMSLRERVS